MTRVDASTPSAIVGKARLVVLVSGNGSNLQAILDASASGRLDAQMSAVISNKVDAYALVRARLAGVPAIALPGQRLAGRRVYDARLAGLVLSFRPDWIILAGWMRLLTSDFLKHFANHVVNLHPALPGAFPGAHAIRDAYQAFLRGEIQQTGVMVHLVHDEAVDSGPVLAQAVVALEPADTLETLEARIHKTEHHLLISAIAGLISPTSHSTLTAIAG